MDGLRLAIVGATGLVGRELLDIITKAQPRLGALGLYASEHSAGEQLTALGQSWQVRELQDCSFKEYDAAFFCVGDELSARYVPLAVDAGCAVVDKSNTYRLDPAVPLVVPGVNDAAVRPDSRLVANPNCTTIVLMHALGPLYRLFGIQRLFTATYQSVSGGGKAPVAEMFSASDGLSYDPGTPRGFAPDPARIAYNVLPQIGGLNELGQASEEAKLINESRKILAAPEMQVACHAVRVPVAIGHAIAVSLELDTQASEEEIMAVWRSSKDVLVTDSRLPTPVSSAGHEQVEVGRLRREAHLNNGWSFFVAGDNLRIGAALNGWRIFKLLQASGALRQTTAGAE